MKSYLIGLMTALLMVVAGTTEAAPKRIKGSGNIVTKTVEVGQFNGITASRAIDVKLVEGKEGSFISFPSRKGKDGKYYSHAYFRLTQEEQDEIIQAALEGLEEEDVED